MPVSAKAAVKTRKTAARTHVEVYKALLAGDGSVGKTSLMRHHVTGKFDSGRQMTIGVDFYTPVVRIQKRTIKLAVWDIGGQKRFAFLRRNFYGGATAAALVFDVSKPHTMDSLTLWRDEILEIAPDARIIVIGNKIDLPRAISPLGGKAWSRAMGYPYLETSAKSGEGIRLMIRGLAGLAAGFPW